jgi:hypothetical protein
MAMIVMKMIIIKVDSHYTTRHDTTRHDRSQRAFTSTGNDKQNILSQCKRQCLSVSVIDRLVWIQAYQNIQKYFVVSCRAVPCRIMWIDRNGNSANLKNFFVEWEYLFVIWQLWTLLHSNCAVEYAAFIANWVRSTFSRRVYIKKVRHK